MDNESDNLDKINRLCLAAGAAQDEEIFAEAQERAPPSKEKQREKWEREQKEDVASSATPFPTHCLPKNARDMTSAISQSLLVPERLSGPCVLGILSAASGKGIHVQSGPDRFTRPNLFLMMSADSGTGKSETIREAAKPLHIYEMNARQTWKECEYPTLEAERLILESDITKSKKTCTKGELSDKIAELEKIKEKVLYAPSLIVEDVTPEELATKLAHSNETLASLSADAGTIVNNVLGRYSNIKRPNDNIYIKAYSGDFCKIDRRSSPPVYLQSPCMVTDWMLQPDKINSLLGEEILVVGGFMARFLVCHSHAVAHEIDENNPTRPIPHAIRDAYRTMIDLLIHEYRLNEGEVHVIKPSAAATKAFIAHHNRIVKRRNNGELRDIAQFAARWNEQAWRISVCLHAGQWGDEAHEQQLIDETAEAAIFLADWFSNEQLEILKSQRMSRQLQRAQKLQSYVLNAGGQQTLRELRDRHGFQHDECIELAEKFPALLRYAVISAKREDGRGGRSSEVLRAFRNRGGRL